MSGKGKSGDVLVTSKQYDNLFSDLVSMLDDCSQGPGGCDHCELCQDCQRTFDALINLRTHYKIKQSDVDMFRDKFINFKKQLTFY